MKKIPWLAVSYLAGLSVLIFCGAQLYWHFQSHFAPKHAVLQSQVAATKRAPIHLMRHQMQGTHAMGRPTTDTTERAP